MADTSRENAAAPVTGKHHPMKDPDTSVPNRATEAVAPHRKPISGLVRSPILVQELRRHAVPEREVTCARSGEPANST